MNKSSNKSYRCGWANYEVEETVCWPCRKFDSEKISNGDHETQLEAEIGHLQDVPTT